MYEAAVEQCPNNEEYMSHLFMAHVRLGGYKKQHQTATKLHKLKPDNHPYHYWGVMSLVMQVSTGLSAGNLEILILVQHTIFTALELQFLMEE